MKSIRQVLEERGFDPTEKLLSLYEELEKDAERLEELLEQNEDMRSVVNPLENFKVKEKVLNTLLKSKQTEDGHVLKLAEIEQSKPKDQKQGIILQHVKKQLPDGRIVIEKVKQIANADYQD